MFINLFISTVNEPFLITKDDSFTLGSSLTTFTKLLVFFSTLAGSKAFVFRLLRSISSASATSIYLFYLFHVSIVDLGIFKVFDSVEKVIPALCAATTLRFVCSG